MFEGMPLGIEPSSRRRAALTAFVLHGTIVFVAVHGTRGSGQPLSRPLLDTVRIELPRAPTPHRAPDVAPRAQSPLVPSPPAVPPLQLESPHAASLKLDFPRVDQVLATILSTTTGPSSRDSSPEDTAVVAASEVDRLPELLGDLTPRYPDELRRVGLSGATLLEYVIDRDGRVVPGSIRVMRTSHPAFAQSAIESLKRARFNPARRAGRSIAVVVRQRIRFESRESY
jgi:TonB family protein